MSTQNLRFPQQPSYVQIHPENTQVCHLQTVFFTHTVRKELIRNEINPTSDTLLIASSSHLPVTPLDPHTAAV